MDLKGIKGFEWDEGNRIKNELKHEVADVECEDIFLNKPLIVAEVTGEFGGEKRFTALGKTRGERLLFVAYTVRNEKIRVISARPMSRKERKNYEKEDQA